MKVHTGVALVLGLAPVVLGARPSYSNKPKPTPVHEDLTPKSPKVVLKDHQAFLGHVDARLNSDPAFKTMVNSVQLGDVPAASVTIAPPVGDNEPRCRQSKPSEAHEDAVPPVTVPAKFTSEYDLDSRTQGGVPEGDLEKGDAKDVVAQGNASKPLVPFHY